MKQPCKPPAVILPQESNTTYPHELSRALKRYRSRPVDLVARLKWCRDDRATEPELEEMISDIDISSPSPFNSERRRAMREYALMALRHEPWITFNELYSRLAGFYSGYVGREIDLFADRLVRGEIVLIRQGAGNVY